MKITSAATPTPVDKPKPVYPMPRPEDAFIQDRNENYVPPKLAQVLEAAGKPYYDEERDLKDIAAYYQDVQTVDYDSVGKLVRRTHREKFGFDPEKRLFPWVDLRPNLRLQSIYSARPRPIDDEIKHCKGSDFNQRVKVKKKRVNKSGKVVYYTENKKVDLRQQAKEWSKILQEGPMDALQIAQKIASVEGHRYYNGEHVVPQHFFGGEGAPKGDMHHLFACERNSNSLRGCLAYGDVAEKTQENRVWEGWAPRGANQFEPDWGKGAVARATLYFLLRYPGEIGDAKDEYTAEHIQTLLKWHRENPVTLYEKHRNQAIAELQGNRNPLIDHPEWADQIDFTKGLGKIMPTWEEIKARKEASKLNNPWPQR